MERASSRASGLVKSNRRLLEPICVALPLQEPRPHMRNHDGRESDDADMGCHLDRGTPVATLNVGDKVICKYLDSRDANASDSVTDHGGPAVGRIVLVPIFYGTVWNSASPSPGAILGAIQTVLGSPYLSELDQYGFQNLDLHPPIQTINNPAVPHHYKEAATDIVQQLIDGGVMPEPDEPGGRNLYMVFYPPGTSIEGGGACGGHRVGWNTIIDLDYTWVGWVDFHDDGKSGPDDVQTPLNNIMKIFTHELVEMISDPQNTSKNTGWRMNREINGGTEIGDACDDTNDTVDGVLACAYWSERHKSCIIPKRHRSLYIDLPQDRLVDQRPGPHGDVTLHTGCFEGEYEFSETYFLHEILFTAHAIGFVSPVLYWELPAQKGGAMPITDGFDATIFITQDATIDGPNGIEHSSGDIPIHVRAVGDTLYAQNVDPSVGSFEVDVIAIATEANSSDSRSEASSFYIQSESITFDERHEMDEVICYLKHHILLKEQWALVTPHTGPDDRRWGWVDQLPQVIKGERKDLVMQGACIAAALEHTEPIVAQKLRTKISEVGAVPLKLLEPRLLRASSDKPAGIRRVISLFTFVRSVMRGLRKWLIQVLKALKWM
jgi:hypothetical protein